MIRSMIAAAALAACATAQADVVYNWQEITPTAELFGTSARLTIADSAWSVGGRLAYQAGGGCGFDSDQPGCLGWSGSPVLSISFATGDPVAGFGIDLRQRSNGPTHRYDLTFRPDGQLNGRIEAGSSQGTELLDMAGASGLWTIGFFGTDLPSSPCSTSAGCAGASGQWLLDIRTIPVPEPGILPLMALASVGLGLSLRKRRR